METFETIEHWKKKQNKIQIRLYETYFKKQIEKKN